MIRNRSILWLVLLIVGLSIVLVYAVSASPVHQAAEGMMLEYDIAEKGTRFVGDETPLHDDGLPAYGNEFITEGYLYPVGTLNGTNGVLDNGDPEFPDQVLGTWTCRGWHVGDGAHTQTGPVVVTTQIFDIGETPGSAMIVTDGFELADMNTPFLRAITGGSGEYVNAGGEQEQEVLGFDESPFGINLRVRLHVMMDSDM
jgi:hypothetical protein